MSLPRILAAALAVLGAPALLPGCGGGNPLASPDTVANPAGGSGQQRLSFVYFQRCIQPILVTPLPVVGGGGTNTCASAGCHDNVSGTGGAFRVSADAQAVDEAAAPELIRASAMYRNFYSAQGEAVIGSAAESRLLAKPRLLNVLHGGGLIFERAEDPLARRIAYWIERPMPQSQDEFSAAGLALLGAGGSCDTP